MAKQYDGIWVVAAPAEAQLARLMQKRGMSEAEARQRIAAQPAQEQKIAAANVVIQNSGSFEDTWRQVASAWQKHVPALAAAPVEPVKSISMPQGDLTVVRGRLKDAENIAILTNRVKRGARLTANDVISEFGDKAYLLLRIGDSLVGVAGWQVENLVARTSEIVLDPSLPAQQVLPPLVQEMERASKDLQCEAALVLAASSLSVDDIWKNLGYERRTPQSLGVSVWQEAAREMVKPGQTLYFKQLRQDRVLRPI
jgi:dephospho-CoA kinase